MARPGNGPIPARVMVVGEAFGEREEQAGQPFVGPSGNELNRMLQEAGILRSEVYVTNLINDRPPNNYLGAWIAFKKKDRTSQHVPLRDKFVLPVVAAGFESLLLEIQAVQPNVILACGNWAMWALTGNYGIVKWRGSLLRSELGPIVIPTFHPAAVLREWSWRAVGVADMKRAAAHMNSREIADPGWRFIVRPSFSAVMLVLLELLKRLDAEEELWIDFDIETKLGHIDCFSLTWSATEAICIPLITKANRAGYWSEEEEAIIIYTTQKILTHKKVKVRGQNLLYDCQYTFRHWHFVPRVRQDTMITAHSCFAALPKALAFLASMHCAYYIFWKEEGKQTGASTEEEGWVYNCKDGVYTRGVGESLAATASRLGLAEVDAMQQRLFWPVLRAMQLGVRVIPTARNQMAADIQEELSSREDFLASILGHAINPGSHVQMQKLFYEDLQQKPILKRQIIDGRTVMRPTCDDAALTRIAAREPLLRPVCNAIADIRTLGKWLKDFVLMRRDEDGRMRCSFNIAGDAAGKSAPYSYRLSSSENAFGSGGNLQTIPSEKSKSAGKAAARGSMEFDLPNIRSMYGPDPGFTFFDMDLDRADLQVVVWESGDDILKAALRIGVDVHLLNVYTLDNHNPPPLEELVESHPRYQDHKGPRSHKREFSKVFCHATNYVGSAKTVAEHTGRSIHEVDKAQKLWFGAHPGILAWHRRTEEQIKRFRFVENRFGYRWYIFDRLEDLLPEAVAWVPQSTVGCLINRIWLSLYDNLPEVMVLLQVHDSLAGQLPSHRKTELVEKMKLLSQIPIPYPDPLIIPTSVKTSEVSWGACA